MTESEHRSIVADRISVILGDAGVPFERVAHDAAKSADEAAKLRGTPLEIGGKSLVMKTDRRGFIVLALRGSDAVFNRALRKHLDIRRYRFATLEELDELTGLTPGCVPPFGFPIFDMPLYVDAGLASADRIAFTAGSHTDSIVMATADWISAAKPADVFAFARAR